MSSLRPLKNLQRSHNCPMFISGELKNILAKDIEHSTKKLQSHKNHGHCNLLQKGLSISNPPSLRPLSKRNISSKTPKWPKKHVIYQNHKKLCILFIWYYARFLKRKMILCTWEEGIKHRNLAKSVKTCKETMPVPLISSFITSEYTDRKSVV